MVPLTCAVAIEVSAHFAILAMRPRRLHFLTRRINVNIGTAIAECSDRML